MSCYCVTFNANGNFAGNMGAKDDMIFAELATKFCEYYSLKEDNKPTFSFNSAEIKLESTKTLKELGIIPNSVIQVKTPKPLTMPANPGNYPGNMQNFQMNNNQFMMNNFGMNQGQGFYQMNPAFCQNMGQMPNNQNMNMWGQMGQIPNNQNMNMWGQMGQMQNNQNMNMWGQMQNNQNMNMWGQMQNNQNNQNNQNTNNNNGEFLNITFYYKGAPIQIQSTSNVRFCDLYKTKFTVKAGNPQTPPSFYFNKEKIDSNETKTLKELKICNQATIQVADDGNNNNNNNNNNNDQFLNIIFNCQGKSFTVQATESTKMCELSVKFCNKAGFPGQNPTFIVNSRKIDSTETKTLKELGMRNQAKVEVVFTSEVIGA